MPFTIKIPAGIKFEKEVQIFLNEKKQSSIKYDKEQKEETIITLDLPDKEINKLRVETPKRKSNTIKVFDGDIIEIKMRLYLRVAAFVVPIIYLLELILSSAFPSLKIAWELKVVLLVFAVIIFGTLLFFGEISMKKISRK